MNGAVADGGVTAGPNAVDLMVHRLDRRKEGGIAFFDRGPSSQRLEIPELELHVFGDVIDDALRIHIVNRAVQGRDHRCVFGRVLGRDKHWSFL